MPKLNVQPYGSWLNDRDKKAEFVKVAHAGGYVIIDLESDSVIALCRTYEIAAILRDAYAAKSPK